MEDFSRSLQVVRFELLTKMWRENSTYSSASNCVFSFVCLRLFNNVVSNSGHVKHKRVSTKPADGVRHCSEHACRVFISVSTQTYEACLICARPACPHGSPSTCSKSRCLPCVRFIVCSILYAVVVLLLVGISHGDVSVVFSAFIPTGRIIICTSLAHFG